MKRAVVPGTFDPITAGHFDVISRAAQIFDEVVVAVAKSAKKSPIFDLKTRVGLVEEAVADLPNVRVISFEGLLVDCVHRLDAQLLRAAQAQTLRGGLTVFGFCHVNHRHTFFAAGTQLHLHHSVLPFVCFADGFGFFSPYLPRKILI